MKFASRTALLVALLLVASGIASADTITFDEFTATNNNVALTNAYAGLGVTFDNRNSGTWGGIANGDLGNWGVNGTNGPQFLGNNGLNNGNSFSESIFFATAQASISFDSSRTNGSSAGQTLTAEAFDASNNLLATDFLTLGAINTWSTFNLVGGGITTVVLIGSANGFSPYAIDNLKFNASPVPEPSSMVLLGTGLIGLLGVARLKLRPASC